MDAVTTLDPCEFCGHLFDRDRLGRYGCPNCEGEGLEAIEPTQIPIDAARLLMPGGKYRELAIVEGWSLQQLIDDALPAALRPMVQAYNCGQLVNDWANFRPRAGDRVLLAIVPQGSGGNSKGIIGAVLAVAIAVFAPYAAGALYTAMGGTFVAANAGIVIAGLTAGITMVGAMVVSALIAPPSVNTGNLTASSPKAYTLSGQSNQARPFGACFVIYGRHKVMPAMAANPNVDNFGSQSQLSALYDFGLGYVSVEELRIGDVAIEQYTPQLVWHQNSYCRDLRLLTARIGYDQYAINLAQNDPVVVRTKPDSYAADMDFQFQRGIFQAAPAFGQIPFWADFAAYWRPVGGSVWQEVPLDWYHGAWDRQYTSAATAYIFFAQAQVAPNGVAYDPATSPATLRAIDAAYRAANEPTNVYIQSIPHFSRVAFQYPDGPINEASYFARYPEIQRAGWTTRSATDHFESIGSREGRDPGVRVLVTANGITQQYNGNIYIPGALHQIDWMFASDPLVGGWGWIRSGAPLPVQSTVRTPFQWAVASGYTFDGANYLARYPDVAAAGQDPWQHFINYGAFEGRDPYVRLAVRSVRLTAMWVGPYWMRIGFVFPSPGEYELQVMRTDKIEDGTDQTINQTSGGAVTARFNESTLALLRSYQHGAVVQPRLRHTMLEMRVVATDQLQGVVQNLNAIATSVLPITADGVNFSWQATRNPAWIALDMLTSEKNPKPISRAQIDWPSWLHLAAVCDQPRSWVANGMPFTAPRYTCDIVVDDFVTVKQLVESVLTTCRASLTLTTAGLWGVLLDEEKLVPRQVLTPGNSWGFSGARTFTPQPHCLRVNYVNRDNGWTKDELPVYWDGYSAANATVYETLDTFGITDYPHAWAFGRYMLAQGLQRSELFTLTLDVENLLVQRGDMVHVAHDVPRVGGVPSRLVDVEPDTGAPPAGRVKIQQALTLPPSGYTLRLSDGSVRTGAASVQPDDWIGIDNVTGAQPDDLIVLGELDRVTQPYLVQRITPGVDFTAELTLCKYEPGVYQADLGLLPDWEPGFGQDYVNGTDLRSVNLVLSQRLYYVDRSPRVDVLMQWTTQGYAFDHHEVSVIQPSGQRFALSTSHKPQNYQWTVDAIRERGLFDMLLQIEIMPVSTMGFRGVPAYAQITLLPDRDAPAVVAQFGANVQSEHIDLWWMPPDEPDIAEYMLRYTPAVENPNWDASQQLAIVGWPNTKISAGARTGSYGLRVKDTSGNLSGVVWRRTTVELLPDINVIEVVNDRDLVPPWPGNRVNVDVRSATIESAGDFGSIAPMGFYFGAEPIDLGDVYEVRISSKIEAYGVTADDYMASPSWDPLAGLLSMASSNSDLWDAWLEVRTANDMLMMAQWLPNIASIDPLAADDDSDWSPWRPCTVGDFTGQLLQFRIVLQSNNPGVRVVVRSGRIEVDMPDRKDAYGDVNVPAAGLDFVFPVAFRVLEAVAITINGNPDPVVAEVSSKDALGFRVVLRNTVTHATTSGYVDILAQGYGRLRAEAI